jgi:outer membrane protein assembly factor BamE (lipoprotein component of BamABCDE complex)
MFSVSLKGDNIPSMKRITLRLFIVCGVVLSLAWASPLFSQQEDVSALRDKNTALEEKVRELEALLKQCKEARENQFSEEHGWQSKKNWRSLEVGMKEDQVTKILGEPVKIIKGVKTFWYYPNMYGGHVSFDEKGAVSGWKEP